MAIKILMPALSPTMEVGKLANWLKKEGDTISSGDVIAEIETDKATMEVDSIDDGVLAKILIPAGSENVAVNSAIAILKEEGDTDDEVNALLSNGSSSPNPKPEASNTDSPKKEVKAETKPDAPIAPAKSGDRIKASPLARKLASQKNIELSQVKGTGPKGRIIKADIESFSGESKASPSTQAPAPQTDVKKTADLLGMAYEEVPANPIRKVIATKLTEAKLNIPHFYLSIDIEMDALLALRKQINSSLTDGKVSINDLIIKACALGLQKVPDANASWTGESILKYKSSDVSVAVASENGLITPIIKNAQSKALSEISREMKDLAGRAKDGKLKPEEYQGGGFTISNLGMFGIKNFSAIINPPQSCILAVGGGEPRVVVRDGEMVIRNIMSCTLSVDHRSVDGAIGAEFLAAFKELMQNPFSMLI